MVKFEYKMVNLYGRNKSEQVQEEFNKLGLEGWELVCANADYAYAYIFKRIIE